MLFLYFYSVLRLFIVHAQASILELESVTVSHNIQRNKPLATLYLSLWFASLQSPGQTSEPAACENALVGTFKAMGVESVLSRSRPELKRIKVTGWWPNYRDSYEWIFIEY